MRNDAASHMTDPTLSSKTSKFQTKAIINEFSIFVVKFHLQECRAVDLCYEMKSGCAMVSAPITAVAFEVVTLFPTDFLMSSLKSPKEIWDPPTLYIVSWMQLSFEIQLFRQNKIYETCELVEARRQRNDFASSFFCQPDSSHFQDSYLKTSWWAWNLELSRICVPTHTQNYQLIEQIWSTLYIIASNLWL